MSVDPRVGSKELYHPLKAMRLPVEKKWMRFGDVVFPGVGPSGPITVAVEYKKLGDLLACIMDKRILKQIRGMKLEYDYCYLLIEGVVRPDKDSGLECFCLFRSKKGKEIGVFNPVFARLTYPMMQRYLMTMENFYDVRVRMTSTKADTIGYLAALYGWWQKPWKKHRAHLGKPPSSKAPAKWVWP